MSELFYSDVDPARIAPDVKIHPGCRIRGKNTFIGSGCILGAEAPLTLVNCQLGNNVELRGGFCSGSVFLDHVVVGSGAQIRPGCLLEEQSGGGHAVGLKQTIFLPFVTAGSLINFCDCLMAGGTSRKNHSEIGSSYVHFNFTPQGDKATASLIGDVPRGVFLDQPPIFLGGQGGLVGPARIEYGCIIAAGTVWRKDALEQNQLLTASPLRGGMRHFEPEIYSQLERKIKNNLYYIGNLHALRLWYEFVRAKTELSRECLAGALNILEGAVNERVMRLKSVGTLLENTALCELAENSRTVPREVNAKDRDEFLAVWQPQGSYLESIKTLDANVRKIGTRWLQGVVDSISNGHYS